MTTFYLARHGQSDWNAADRFQGHADRPLTELGGRQAAELAELLAGTAKLDGVYSSPLRRALDTASIVGSRLGLEVVAVPELQEVDVGAWAGLSRTDVQTRFPDAFQRWLDGGEGWEDGETFADMSSRVLAALLELAEAHPGDALLVVSHGGPIRAIQAAAAGMDVHTHRRLHRVEPNARLSRVAVENGRISRLD